MRKIYDFQSSLDRIPLEEIDLYPNRSNEKRAHILRRFPNLLIRPI